MIDQIIDIKNLSTHFLTRAGIIKAVDDISFGIETGYTTALVGESGCGKSVTGLSILRLVPPPGVIVSGRIIFGGTDLLTLSDEEMRQIRGKQIAMIFQDPMTSLNPVYTAGDQIAEAAREHEGLSSKAALERAIDMMDRVKIPDPRKRAGDYPHQLSGGMRQRVMIAMALICNPKLLIADEPTTALDVTIQAEILRLLQDLREEFDLSILLITHDLGVVAENADRVAVMYAGQLIEQADVKELYFSPRHPYTEGLLRSVPKLTNENPPPISEAAYSPYTTISNDHPPERPRRLETIEGTVPNLLNLPQGCRFSQRCPYRIDKCVVDSIPFDECSQGHFTRCIRHMDIWKTIA